MKKKFFKIENIIFIFLILYSPLILKYFNSIGLMDDYQFKYGSEFFKYDLNYFVFQFNRGGYQILFPFQIWLQGLSFKLLPDNYYYLLNLVIIIGILRYGAFVVNKYIKINHIIFYFIFFSYPYFFDYIVHPSIQEKYIFLVFFMLLHLLKSKTNNISLFLITVLSTIIPFIKLQATPLWVVLLLLAIKNNFERKYIYSLIPYSISNIFILFTLFTNSGYFSNKVTEDFDFIIYLKNLTSEINLIIFLLSTIALIFYLKFNKNSFGISIVIYQILLTALMTTTTAGGNYLSGIYAFTLSIIFGSLAKVGIFKSVENLFSKLVLLILIISNILFFIPRAERWYDLGSVIDGLRVEHFNKEIIYTCKEGVITLNKMQKNKIIYLDSAESLKNRKIDFISDSYSCNNLEKILNLQCNKLNDNKYALSKYNKVAIRSYEC